MEWLDGIVVAAKLASVALSSANSGTFALSTTEVSWKGRDGRSTWCRLFTGDRFHMAGGMHSQSSRQNVLPVAKLSAGRVVVPETTLKDIISMVENTRLFSTSNGTVTERYVELTARKVTTSSVNVAIFQGYKGLYVSDNRFVLDPTTGLYSAQTALQKAINQNKESFEIVLGEEPLKELVQFLLITNSSGGYGACEVRQVSDSWYAVRGITLFGKAKAQSPVERFGGSITHRLRQGKRYVSEYHGATHVGAGRTSDMFALYHDSGLSPYTKALITPVRWSASNKSADRRWKLEANVKTYSVLEEGKIEMIPSRKEYWIHRPLFGVTLNMESRDSKTGCAKLTISEESGNVGPATGYASPLSLPTAGQRHTERWRAKHQWYVYQWYSRTTIQTQSRVLTRW